MADAALPPSSRGIKHCADCGWIFVAKEHERCPRCGLPAAVSFESEADLTGTLARDTACRKCGYNLRGLARSGNCPECGAPVVLSTRGDFLCFAEPSYVDRLACGALWIIRGLTISIASAILFAIAQIISTIAPPAHRVDRLLLGACQALSVGGVGAGLLLFLAGVWFLTSAAPGADTGWRRDRTRKLARAGLLIGILGWGLEIALEYLAPPLPVMAAFEFFYTGLAVCGVIGLVAYFYYLRDIALRIPDEGFAARAGSLALNFAIALGVLVLISTAQRIALWAPLVLSPATVTAAPSPLARPLGLLAGCLSGVASLAALVLFLRAASLHSNLRRPLEQQAKLAKEHWRAFGVPA